MRFFLIFRKRITKNRKLHNLIVGVGTHLLVGDQFCWIRLIVVLIANIVLDGQTKYAGVRALSQRNHFFSGYNIAAQSYSPMFQFSLLADILQMLLSSKIKSHISSNFCPDHQDGRWIIKALNANQYYTLSHVTKGAELLNTVYYNDREFEHE